MGLAGAVVFPGASTPGKSITGGGAYSSVATTGITQASAFAATAEGQFEALQTAAAAAKSAASAALNTALGYSPGAAPGVSFAAPSFSAAGSATVSANVTPLVPTFTPVQSAAFTASFSPGSAPQSSVIAAPDTPTLSLDPVPTASGVDAVSAVAMPTQSAPTLSYTPGTYTPAASAAAPGAITTSLPSGDFGAAPAALVLPEGLIDTTALDAAKAALESFSTFADPTSDLTTTLLTGSPWFQAALDKLDSWQELGTYAALDAANSTEFADNWSSIVDGVVDVQARLWNGRGQLRTAAQAAADAAYADVVSLRERSVQEKNNAARSVRWAYEDAVLRRDAFFELYNTVVELDTRTYQLRIDSLLVQAGVQIDRVKAAVGEYNAAVALLSADAEAYAAQLQTYDAMVRRFKAEVEAEAAKGGINEIRARTFSTQVRAEISKQSTYEAQIGIEKQKVEALAAQVSARSIALAKAEVEVEKYRAQALLYSNELVQTRRLFSTYSAQAAAVTAANRAQASKARADGVKLSASTQQVRVAAAQVESQNAVIRAAAAQRAAALQNVITTNRAVDVQAGAKAAVYDASLTPALLQAVKARAEAGVSADKAQAAMRYISTTAQPAEQAVQLAQSANAVLANAYASLYEAAGRAAAAAASGELSGFRASKSISASYNLSGTEDFSMSESQVRQVSVSEDDAYSAEAGA